MGRRVLADFDLDMDKLTWIEHFPEESHRMMVGMLAPQTYPGAESAISWRPIRPNERSAIRPYLPELD